MIRKIIEDINQLKVKYDDNYYIFVPLILVLALGSVLYYYIGIEIALFVVTALTLFFILSFQFHLYRKTEEDLEEERRQQQAITAIHELIDIRLPLPPMTGRAAQPELASTIMEYIFMLQPKFILEAGSGASTVITCYCLEKLNEGRILSLDHDETYRKKTQELLQRHGLEPFGEVIYAPLRDYDLNGKSWQWYDLQKFGGSRTIDLLVVDGPPVKTQSMARYPALPLLHEHLSDQAVVILDDAARRSEWQCVERWLEEFPEFVLEYRHNRKGIAVLSRDH